MKISFIIVNYQSRDFLKRCIDSVYEHAPFASYEIVIANNDTSDIENFSNNASIKIINNHKNLGFARACNAAAQKSEGEILFFLNPDTKITTSNIDEFINVLNNPAIGIAAPSLITSSETIQPWSMGKKITPLSLVLTNLFHKKHFSSSNINDLTEIDWVSGGAFIILKKLFLSCGGFDENFFLYFEDVDLCKRIQSLGKKIMFFPSTKVLHLGGQSIPDIKKQKFLYYQSQDYYFQKHFGLISSYFIKLLRNLVLFLKKI